MPKNNKLKSVLIIGSGPIVIGQACEFDYSGSQAARSLREEGIEVSLINSNPATIMTDKVVAEHVYLKPLTTASIVEILEERNIDAVLPTMGGQTALNLCIEVDEKGIWKKYGVDIVLECTGKYNSKEKAIFHIKNGAKKVIISAPCKNADKTVVYGVNHKSIKKSDLIISAASCTTNCLAPIAFVIHNKFKIESGFMTTIHSYTTDQRLLDNSHKDPRRARSAGQSIIPTSTGASKSLEEIIPELKGKLEGLALRVPTPNVSLVDFVFTSKKKLSINKINSSFIKASNKELKNVLDTTSEKLVSVDFNHNSNSAIVDFSLTSVVGNNMGKVSAWYDNEWGFASRVKDLVEYIHNI